MSLGREREEGEGNGSEGGLCMTDDRRQGEEGKFENLMQNQISPGRPDEKVSLGVD